jgi:hypothetical protein
MRGRSGRVRVVGVKCGVTGRGAIFRTRWRLLRLD